MRHNLIRRPSQMSAVWLSYWTRWQLVLVVLTAGSGLALVLPIMLTGNPHVVRSAEPSAPEPFQTKYVGSAEDAAKLDWSTVRSLMVHNLKACEPFWTPGRAPKLESLAVLDGVNDEQLAKLCELYDLKSLTLYNVGLLTAEGWKAFQGETKLTYLRLIGAHALHNEPSLTWPPNLQTLLADDTHGQTQQRLKEWQRLPHLTTLSTRIIPQKGDLLAPEILDTLKHFPSLRRLYLVEMGKHAPNYIAVQQAALPSVRVRPAHYHPERGRRAAAIVITGMLLLVVLSIQMSSQFITAASVLTPRFARSHLSLVIGVMVVQVAVSFGLLVWIGCSSFIALCLCGASALLIGAGTLGMSRLMGGVHFPGFNNVGIALLSLVLPTICVVVGLLLFGDELDWFLRGQHPVLALLVLAGSGWGVVRLLTVQAGMKRRLEEAGVANVPMGMLDQSGWAEWMMSVAAARGVEANKEPLPYRRMDKRLDHFIARHQANRRSSLLELWRLGGQGSIGMLWLYVIGLIGLFLFAGIPVALFAPELWNQFAPTIAAPMVFQLLGGGLLMPLTLAWTRKPTQEMELLRPVSRRDWNATWFAGVASEMALALGVFLGFGIALWGGGLMSSMTAVQLGIAGIIVIGIVANVFAVGMETITLRSLWQLPLVGGGVWFGLVLLTIPLFLLAPMLDKRFPGEPPFEVIVALIVGLTVFLYGMAGLGLWLAWRRWMKWEVGMLS